MRHINELIVHCSATPPDMDIGAATIRKWHKARGWRDIGYHHIILRSGEVQIGRQERVIGAHTRGHNSNSIGICLIGGVDYKGNADANFTRAQYKSLEILLRELRAKYPESKVVGHRNHANKACPSFDVEAWWYS